MLIMIYNKLKSLLLSCGSGLYHFWLSEAHVLLWLAVLALSWSY